MQDKGFDVQRGHKQVSVSVSAKYTKDTVIYNGLDAIEKDLIEEGLNGAPKTHYAVVALEVTSIDIDVASGKRQPRVNLKNIEVMHGDNEPKVKAMLDAEFRYRNGRMDAPSDTLFDGEPGSPVAAIEAPAVADGSGTVDGEGPGTAWPTDSDYAEKAAETAGDGATADAGTPGGEDGDAAAEAKPRSRRGSKGTAE